jgi:predicted small lipoprotein YifL
MGEKLSACRELRVTIGSSVSISYRETPAPPMNQSIRTFLALSILSVFGLSLIGCGDKSPALPPSVTPPPPASDSTADHDHDHDHPEHGERGGHMVELSDGSKVEVLFADDLDFFTVFANDPDKVSKVEMITKIGDEEKTYEFEKTATFDSAIFGLTDPELSTAAKMGEGVDIQLVITSEDGVLTGGFEHHEH